MPKRMIRFILPATLAMVILMGTSPAWAKARDAVCPNDICEPPDEDPCNCSEDCGDQQAETSASVCTDGIDNDCDGDIDCADVGCVTEPACQIDLLFDPLTQDAVVEDIVGIDIIARASGDTPGVLTAVDAIIHWDPDVLELVGADEPAGHPWTLCFGFYADLCGINQGIDDPPEGVPDNDGDAVYTAATFNRVVVGPEGLIVTTLQFRALAPTPGTDVEYLAQVQGGGYTCITRVFGVGYQKIVTGGISGQGQVVTQCGLDAHCDDGDVCTDDTCVEGACQHVYNTAPCDDGLFCTATDTCSEGVCSGSGDPCTDVCSQCNDQDDVCDWCVFDLDQAGGGIGTGDFGIFSGCFGLIYPPGHPDYDDCLASNFDDQFGEQACGAGSDPDCYGVGTGDFGVFSGCFALTCGGCASCFPD